MHPSVPVSTLVPTSSFCLKWQRGKTWQTKDHVNWKTIANSNPSTILRHVNRYLLGFALAAIFNRDKSLGMGLPYFYNIFFFKTAQTFLLEGNIEVHCSEIVFKKENSKFKILYFLDIELGAFYSFCVL